MAGKTAVASDNVAAANSAAEESIAQRAYLIYLEEGRPDGRHLDHWVRAEAELRS